MLKIWINWLRNEINPVNIEPRHREEYQGEIRVHSMATRRSSGTIWEPYSGRLLRRYASETKFIVMGSSQ